MILILIIEMSFCREMCGSGCGSTASAGWEVAKGCGPLLNAQNALAPSQKWPDCDDLSHNGTGIAKERCSLSIQRPLAFPAARPLHTPLPNHEHADQVSSLAPRTRRRVHRSGAERQFAQWHLLQHRRHQPPDQRQQNDQHGSHRLHVVWLREQVVGAACPAASMVCKRPGCSRSAWARIPTRF